MKNKEVSEKSKKKPWPTKDAMEQVYKMKLWGDNNTDFYSGEGSHHPLIVNSYIASVISFLTSFDNKLTVCDLGCGDFNVGISLVEYTKKYSAVDIVASLIAHNKEKFQRDNLNFQCLDIAVDDLPSGDCVFLRQVLQHLSNREVQLVLNKLDSFKYVIVTEHIPEGDFIPNSDIISGQGTRLKQNSGLKIVAPPFNFKTREEKQISSVVLSDNRGVIVTTLYKSF